MEKLEIKDFHALIDKIEEIGKLGHAASFTYSSSVKGLAVLVCKNAIDLDGKIKADKSFDKSFLFSLDDKKSHIKEYQECMAYLDSLL